MDKVYRSLGKTISWRLLVLVIDFSIAYFFTGDFDVSSKLAVAKFIVASIFFYVHERIWNQISWGRN